ncbi:kinase-like protein [Fomitiporia mediterranea MF3/22]|uniref:kinase-like protein n=1 Tax=Fomitiporia mediterranea (strain MF3/22) TaxID=694068 RepID=UPI0004407548|nr:kinase-like protein [Fomitiporia mediterranea MF3/22]EJD04732.1 kinase-like protein [Fomitiporia mediterranea MF3/22]
MFRQNAPVWASFEHPHILPLLGICSGLEGNRTALISRWMEHGTVENFIKMNPGADRLKLITEMASGLAYLHSRSPPYVHGILSGVNVLISNSGEPLLCDFGLAIILEDLTQMPISSLLQDAGNPRWMAPELFVGEQQASISTASDVWALGMVFLEIMTLDMPYPELKNSAQVIVEVHKGVLPSRPTGEDAVRRGLNDNLWALLLKCWEKNPSGRPSANDVLKELEV